MHTIYYLWVARKVLSGRIFRSTQVKHTDDSTKAWMKEMHVICYAFGVTDGDVPEEVLHRASNTTAATIAEASDDDE
jgi:hypothetical protein